MAEDAERNRVYLPLEDLAAHDVSLDSLLHRAPGAPPTANERALLAAIAQRAEDYYQSAQQLLPLIDRESRPALWVLVSIYHALLKRIERADYDVFSAAPACRWQKLILAWAGAWLGALGDVRCCCRYGFTLGIGGSQAYGRLRKLIGI